MGWDEVISGIRQCSKVEQRSVHYGGLGAELGFQGGVLGGWKVGP